MRVMGVMFLDFTSRFIEFAFVLGVVQWANVQIVVIKFLPFHIFRDDGRRTSPREIGNVIP